MEQVADVGSRHRVGLLAERGKDRVGNRSSSVSPKMKRADCVASRQHSSAASRCGTPIDYAVSRAT